MLLHIVIKNLIIIKRRDVGKILSLKLPEKFDLIKFLLFGERLSSKCSVIHSKNWMRMPNDYSSDKNRFVYIPVRFRCTQIETVQFLILSPDKIAKIVAQFKSECFSFFLFGYTKKNLYIDSSVTTSCWPCSHTNFSTINCAKNNKSCIGMWNLILSSTYIWKLEIYSNENEHYTRVIWRDWLKDFFSFIQVLPHCIMIQHTLIIESTCVKSIIYTFRGLKNSLWNKSINAIVNGHHVVEIVLLLNVKL